MIIHTDRQKKILSIILFKCPCIHFIQKYLMYRQNIFTILLYVDKRNILNILFTWNVSVSLKQKRQKFFRKETFSRTYGLVIIIVKSHGRFSRVAGYDPVKKLIMQLLILIKLIDFDFILYIIFFITSYHQNRWADFYMYFYKLDNNINRYIGQ